MILPGILLSIITVNVSLWDDDDIADAIYYEYRADNTIDADQIRGVSESPYYQGQNKDKAGRWPNHP